MFWRGYGINYVTYTKRHTNEAGMSQDIIFKIHLSCQTPLSGLLIHHVQKQNLCWPLATNGKANFRNTNVPRSKVAILGMVIPPLIGILIMGI